MSSPIILRLGLAGGRVIRVDLDADSQLPATLSKAPPESLFVHEPWWFAQTLCFAAIRPETVHFLHLAGTEPGWPYPFEIELIEWMTGEDFATESAARRLQTKIKLTDAPPGTRGVQYFRLIMADGSAQHFRVTGPTRAKEERFALAKKIAALPALVARHPGGGQVAINLHMAIAWQVLPGIVDPPPGSWTASDIRLE